MKLPIAYKEAALVVNVWKLYKNSEDALLTSRQTILSKIKGGKKLPQEFMFKTPDEIKGQFGQSLKELKYAAMLGLISAIEAAFRIDHQIRLEGKKKDEISQKFLQLAQEKKSQWSKFGDDILDTWMDLPSNEQFKETIITLKGMLRLRDWLAHGRCWERRFSQQYDPETIHLVAEQLIHNLPHNNFFGRKYLGT